MATLLGYYIRYAPRPTRDFRSPVFPNAAARCSNAVHPDSCSHDSLYIVTCGMSMRSSAAST